MLTKNILINKFISIFCIIILLLILIISSMPNKVSATASSTIANNTADNNELSEFEKYPGYVDLLKKLKEAHPNWTFEILKTNLDWNTVIKAESTGYHGRNVVPKSWDGCWKCTCGKVVDASWVCASSSTVAYYMDPRNSLSEDYVFQFEKLTFGNHTDEELALLQKGVEAIIADCNYLQGKITYHDSEGNVKNIDKTYSQVIMEAAKDNNVSPYHLASRMRQEQGSGNGTYLITGTYKDYEGLYNYFNVGAFGSTTENIIKNGLTTAKNNGWTDPEKAIKGGASVINSNYIKGGQDTLYLEKFDVVGDTLYSFQYMTNVSASKEEGKQVYNAYKKSGMITEDSKVVFKIPVYENMPAMASTKPGSEKFVTEDVQINTDKVQAKEGKGTSFKTIATLSKDTKLLRIELDQVKDSEGKYWDKVVLSDGKKAYIMRDYLTKLSIQTNCDEAYVVSANTNFRNGPGVTATTIYELLKKGTKITVVEKGKYKSVDGEEWYRVKTADGTYGYVGTGYIKKEVIEGNNAVTTTSDYKVESTNLITKPDTTIETIKKHLNNAVIKNADKKEQKSGKIATGWTITSGTETYTIIVKGDVNGDGKVNTGDTLAMSQHIEAFKKITNANYLKSADVNEDGKVNTGDSLALRQHVENFKSIELK